jgi:serine protease AprX
MGTKAIPPFVVDWFLLGKTHRDAIERYTTDGGIVSDVWLGFAKNIEASQRVLLTPKEGTTASRLGYTLHRAIRAFRHTLKRGKPGVSALENYISATIFLDELLGVVLPMSTWWQDKKLSSLRRKAARSGEILEEILEKEIRRKLGRNDNGERLVRQEKETDDVYPDRRVIQAASLAALIGVFRLAQTKPRLFDSLRSINPKTPEGEGAFADWVNSNAELIAMAARQELTKPFLPELLKSSSDVEGTRSRSEEPPVLVHRVFLDREATLADTGAISTIKADAAKIVFEISCRDITWAIIDSGIATNHQAFFDHPAFESGHLPQQPSRIRATYDFTLIEQIRNYDLIFYPAKSLGRRSSINSVVNQLLELPGRDKSTVFRALARKNLESIANQLEQGLPPDWALIEPLIRCGSNDNGAQLVSDHGTHVAGILAGDWRKKLGSTQPTDVILKGVCPDLNVYDLRVINPKSRKSTEFAILGALEFIQFINARKSGAGPVIHGVNISLAIPHDVRNYGCGATPICVACDQVVNSGVVVIAAAGNRGWNEQEAGFGNFVFCSITDPGNAREVITVGSTHRLKPHTYGVSYFSSRGPTGDGRVKPDLVAPGEQVRGPIRGGADDQFDGTSMAAPFVSGAAAMLLSRHRELIGNPRRVKEILCKTATDLGREKYFQGHGLLDVLRALQAV